MRVIVVGGGPAGLVAAIAAARRGVEVLLVEAMGYLGGNSGPVGHNFFNGFYNGKTRKQIIKGIPQEVVDRLMQADASLGHVLLNSGLAITPFSAEAFRFVADDMVLEAGVRVLFHSSVVAANVESGLIRKIVVANRDGLTEHMADVYIDATGDGDLSAHAGVPFFKAPVEDIQRSTLMFKLSHVNLHRIVAYAVRYPDEVSFTPNNLGIFGFRSLIAALNQEAISDGKPSPFPRRILIALSGLVPGEYWMLMTDVAGDASTAAGLTKLEIDARREAWRMIPYLKRIPGFEGAQLTQVANRVGIRETRHVIGNYVLAKDDVVNGHEFSDCVCRIGQPADMHDTPREPFFRPQPIESERGMYDVPYRCLLPLQVDNLLVAGRCMSADAVAGSSLRLGACCMATGQVAGVAAVLALQHKMVPRALNVRNLQQILAEMGTLDL